MRYTRLPNRGDLFQVESAMGLALRDSVLGTLTVTEVTKTGVIFGDITAQEKTKQGRIYSGRARFWGKRFEFLDGHLVEKTTKHERKWAWRTPYPLTNEENQT